MYSDPHLDVETKKSRERFVEERGRQLQNITTESVEKSLVFLFTANAGSAVGLLAYLGAVSKNPSAMEFKVALSMFFTGVLFVGIFRAFITEVYGSIFKKFRKLVDEYFQDKKSWEVFCTEMNSQVKENNIPRVFVYTSFVCFFLGCIFGVVGIYA